MRRSIGCGPAHAAEYQALEGEYDAAFSAVGGLRPEGRTIRHHRATDSRGRRCGQDVHQRVDSRRAETKSNYADVNYVFPTFVIEHLPVGLVGLLIAAIFAAAMSSIAAELNALATATVIDVYRRLLKPVADDRHYLNVSKLATAGWGVFACVMALYAAQLGSLIEVVNRYGSYFYGSILGVFILAIGTKRANGHGAFVGLIGGMIAVWYVATATRVEFLWLNVVGAVAVTVIGLVVSAMTGGRKTLGAPGLDGAPGL